ncbi:hypothetical protein C0993_003637 [Termitomyces sp. T159_Od127]|nr:hypothetical protein C0993_003637 [Termitomyces sp. T159_Od127]
MITGFSIATLIIFVISMIFVIFPVHLPLRLPYLGFIRIPINLTTAPIFAIVVLWAAQCLGPRTVSIVIEALEHQGWIELFSVWLVNATSRKMHAVIWLIGVLGVILCNLAGTNIGATILLTKVVRAAALDAPVNRAAAIALAVASNIGAVSFTYSASLAGLLWKQILEQKGINIKQRTFAYWNLLPVTMMTIVGLVIVSAEMAVLYG